MSVILIALDNESLSSTTSRCGDYIWVVPTALLFILIIPGAKAPGYKMGRAYGTPFHLQTLFPEAKAPGYKMGRAYGTPFHFLAFFTVDSASGILDGWPPPDASKPMALFYSTLITIGAKNA